MTPPCAGNCSLFISPTQIGCRLITRFSRSNYEGFSGGDILNVCVNAIHAGSTDPDPANWMVTQAILEREIAKAKKAKAEYTGEKSKSRRRIGFQSAERLPLQRRKGAEKATGTIKGHRFVEHTTPCVGGIEANRHGPVKEVVTGLEVHIDDA